MDLQTIRGKAMLRHLKPKLTGGNKCQGLPVCKMQPFYSFPIQGIPRVESRMPYERVTEKFLPTEVPRLMNFLGLCGKRQLFSEKLVIGKATYKCTHISNVKCACRWARRCTPHPNTYKQRHHRKFSSSLVNNIMSSSNQGYS